MTSQRTRDRMVVRLQEEGIRDQRVLAAISRTPRHLFVDEALATRAYEDTALPIGFGQTISQPYVVARMTEVVVTGPPPKKVLELGTGCGYQTAILAQLAEQVFSIERIGELSRRANEALRELNLSNVVLRVGDGWQGWPEQAPFDAIVVTAAPEKVPPALLEQLAEGGRLVIPVGEEQDRQRLLHITRSGNDFEEEMLDWVSFVPLVKESR
ncbi:MAG: protein-L-isoaspartate(D-aspartate) O-methyltransferase [Gammaproteobacteria bacterium]|nr:protein-L-isoaspartate(D-aspartate) O-methyltransferase [Gammaproteobacteria bacterium]